MRNPGSRARRARRLAIGWGATVLCTLLVAGVFFGRPLRVRWHLERLRAEPDRLGEYLEAPSGSVEESALRAYIRSEAGLSVLLGAFAEVLGSADESLARNLSMPLRSGLDDGRLKLLLFRTLGADGRSLDWDALSVDAGGETHHLIGSRILEEPHRLRRMQALLGDLVGRWAAPERYRPMTFLVERAEDAMKRLAAVHEDKRPELQSGEPVLVILGGPRMLLGILSRTDPRGGVLIERVERGTSAERAGLVENDRVLGAAGKHVLDHRELHAQVAKRFPGGSLELLVERDGKPRKVTVRVEPPRPWPPAPDDPP